jgi:uncharacterized protein (DUF169 family)
MISLTEINAKLTEYLCLQTFPVAVGMLESEREPSRETSVNEGSIRMPMPVCQGVALSRRYGWKILMGPGELSCPLGAVALGFVPPKPQFLDGSLEVPRWVTTKEARAKIARNIPKLEYGRYNLVALAPLASADFEPNLVVIYGNPAQIMRLVQSCSYSSGDPVVSSSTGAAGCSFYISKALLTDECQFVLSGPGDRIFGSTQDHEVCFSIPMARIEGVLRGLEETHRAGMRLPIRTYLRYQPQLPDTYRDLMEYLKAP